MKNKIPMYESNFFKILPKMNFKMGKERKIYKQLFFLSFTFTFVNIFALIFSQYSSFKENFEKSILTNILNNHNKNKSNYSLGTEGNFFSA